MGHKQSSEGERDNETRVRENENTRLLVNRAVAAWQPSQDLPTLTRRELEVLILIGQGLSNPQIAEALFITRHTVRSHIKHINSKLGLDSRSQAMRYAIDHGLASAPSDHHP